MTPSPAELLRLWWYYTVEVAPGQIAKGTFPDDCPLLPRLLLRNCDVTGMDCLDVGSMEGLIPVVLRRRGAGRIVASDAGNHCALKMSALQQLYQAQFDFWQFDSLYNLSGQCPLKSFDFINLAGVLYHVFSPLLVLAGIRPLLKQNGLMIVATNVVEHDGFFMELNSKGRLQAEANTFWYISIPALDYMLRYFKLAPIDCLYLPHAAIHNNLRYSDDKPTGYLAIVCRAVANHLPTLDDAWMGLSVQTSWEYLKLANWNLSQMQATSRIVYNGSVDRSLFRAETDSLDLLRAAANARRVTTTAKSSDAHILRLDDRE